MNILFIAPRLPLPVDTGGKIRTFNLLKQLAKQAHIHLVCFSFSDEDKKLCLQLEEIGIHVILVPIKEPGFGTKITQGVFNHLPVSIAKYYTEEMESVLSELNETNQFDAVHVDHLHMAHYQHCYDGVPRVIDEHNVEYKILERCANVERSLIKKLVFRNQAKKMKTFETQQIKDFSAFLTVSGDDKKLLEELGGDPRLGYVIPNGVDTEYFQKQETGRRAQEEDALVFTGSMDWLPNADSVIFFIEDILPIIWREHPDVKFYVVGKNPPDKLIKAAQQDQRIHLTGRVDDVRPYVTQAKIFVVPLRVGGGTRLKILEAMSMEKAILSTSIGAEGIDHTEDQNIVIADEPEVFAQKTLSLLNDSEKCKLLGEAGRKLVLAKYDWNIVGEKLNRIYEDALHVDR